ncbi:hypothetical protein [Streptomyces sp. NPDC050528]|uniref:hypothetical protein n=1 Tax=Streptomyces sp. NPDC050528 TaxID=3365623 RepID=UPI0037B93FA8
MTSILAARPCTHEMCRGHGVVKRGHAEIVMIAASLCGNSSAGVGANPRLGIDPPEQRVHRLAIMGLANLHKP